MKVHLALIASLVLLSIASAPAAVKSVGYWRMGEDESGTDGQELVKRTGISDTSGGANLASWNEQAPTYSSDVPPKQHDVTESKVSTKFDISGQPYLRQDHVTTFNFDDNFGVEAWIKPASLGQSALVIYNGRPDTSTGWGIFYDSKTQSFQGILGHVTFIGSAPAAADQWTHIAMVRDMSTFGTRLYVNGALVVEDAKSSIIPTTGSEMEYFSVGSAANAIQPFDGWIDELRVFTFKPGKFDADDLLVKP